MRKIYLVFLTFTLSLCLFACMSSPSRRYFQIYLTPDDGMDFQTIDKTLMIESIGMDELYDDFRIVYRESLYQVNFYSYEFWAEKPDQLTRYAIVHYLLEKKAFRKIIQELSKGTPDLLLKMKIHIIEEVDTVTDWYARLSMELEAIDFSSRESVHYYNFDRREKLTEKEVSQVPIAISRILREELVRFIRDLSTKVR
jgi:uncharacterized lipoprotein YmbA